MPTAHVCTGGDLLWACPIVQCRKGAMPLTCVLVVAILPSLNTSPQKWRATSLTLMMMDTQPCTGQPKRASCPWWSTLWDPVDLMWRQLTRLAFIVCCLSDAFCDLCGHTCSMRTVDIDACTWVLQTSLFVYVNKTPVLSCCLHMYTSWCGALLVDILVPSVSTLSTSFHVQWGNTPLLIAAANGCAEVARFLLESGSSVQEENNVGGSKRTSVHFPVIM